MCDVPFQEVSKVDNPGETKHWLIGQNSINNFTGNIIRLQDWK